MVKWTKYHFGQRPKYARTKVGAFAQRAFAQRVWASPYSAEATALLRKADYDNAATAINALGATTPVDVNKVIDANKAIYYFMHADKNVSLGIARDAKLSLGKNGFEANNNRIFALPNSNAVNQQYLTNVANATGLDPEILRNASYYKQVQILPGNTSKKTIPDDLIVWEGLPNPPPNGPRKKYAIIIDSKLSELSPETVSQEGFITLTQFYQDAGWDNTANIRSATDNIARTKGLLDLRNNDNIEVLHILRVNGDSSPSGIPNFTKK